MRGIRKILPLPFLAATFYMVSGGPYGTEEIVGKAGFAGGLFLIAVLPFVWSVPTALMVGELVSSLPKEGGYYVWVYRGLGRFWAFQESWLSFAASIFDMALYPTLFRLYLSEVAPSLTRADRGMAWEVGMVLLCLTLNLFGVRLVGLGALVLLSILLTPFLILVIVVVWQWHGIGSGATFASGPPSDVSGALSITLWQYMGWDNASTIAQEVNNPQRTYPRVILTTVVMVTLAYFLPILAVGLAGIPTRVFTTGAWAAAASTIAGPWLGVAVMLGAVASAVGQFMPLMMSYSRLPPAMARDGLMPAVFSRSNRYEAPYTALLLCTSLWLLALNLTFERLISIDLVLYGSALLLEFVALIALRIREPELPRPFRVPGNLLGVCMVGAGPTALIGFAIWTARYEKIGGVPSLLVALVVSLLGPVCYPIASRARGHC